MVLTKDILDRVEEAGKSMCPKSDKPLRGEALARWSCRRFDEMMRDTCKKLSNDLAVFYFRQLKRSPSKQEKDNLAKIYYSLFMNPAKSLKQYGRFVPTLNKVKVEDLKETLGRNEVGTFASFRLLQEIWSLNDPNRHPLAKVLFLVITKEYENSLRAFHKLQEYSGVEGPMGRVQKAASLLSEAVKDIEKTEAFKLK